MKKLMLLKRHELEFTESNGDWNQKGIRKTQVQVALLFGVSLGLRCSNVILRLN